MNHGDLVHVLLPRKRYAGHPVEVYLSNSTGEAAVGIIIDTIEDENGFYNYEVLIEGERSWWPDIQVRLVDDSE